MLNALMLNVVGPSQNPKDIRLNKLSLAYLFLTSSSQRKEKSFATLTASCTCERWLVKPYFSVIRH